MAATKKAGAKKKAGGAKKKAGAKKKLNLTPEGSKKKAGAKKKTGATKKAGKKDKVKGSVKGNMTESVVNCFRVFKSKEDALKEMKKLHGDIEDRLLKQRIDRVVSAIRAGTANKYTEYEVKEKGDLIKIA